MYKNNCKMMALRVDKAQNKDTNKDHDHDHDLDKIVN
jgi:hypothetical protein